MPPVGAWGPWGSLRAIAVASLPPILMYGTMHVKKGMVHMAKYGKEGRTESSTHTFGMAMTCGQYTMALWHIVARVPARQAFQRELGATAV